MRWLLAKVGNLKRDKLEGRGVQLMLCTLHWSTERTSVTTGRVDGQAERLRGCVGVLGGSPSAIDSADSAAGLVEDFR